ncbi:MAG: integrin alpha [Candidatus Midichloria sp.]|uniref:FG-GAP repeat-containing protein n=1 Tax=Hyalomma marginatum TaxID=34627 RepID=A0A8S4C203_9ACAR|nr:FG-GAP repeat-containing protein [Hyalomma marginatum]CAG7594189.1 FG-GAP repeat-containing protein [Hyalomma marginatum]
MVLPLFLHFWKYVSSLNCTNSFTINGVKSNCYAGYSVAGAGDVNNDGSSMAGQEYSVFGEVADLSLPIFDIYIKDFELAFLSFILKRPIALLCILSLC